MNTYTVVFLDDADVCMDVVHADDPEKALDAFFEMIPERKQHARVVCMLFGNVDDVLPRSASFASPFSYSDWCTKERKQEREEA